eukprot:6042446-Prymnesium_polylepis.1
MCIRDRSEGGLQGERRARDAAAAGEALSEAMGGSEGCKKARRPVDSLLRGAQWGGSAVDAHSARGRREQSVLAGAVRPDDERGDVLDA